MDSESSLSAEQILEQLMKLPPKVRRDLGRRLRSDNPAADLNRKEERFVDEYAAHLNPQRAAEAAGISPRRGYVLLSGRFPGIDAAVDEKLEERAVMAGLTAEYVRDYIRSILELCPTDCFELADDGDWVVDPARFAEMPHEVKRLVESVEVKIDRFGERKYKVNFLSKTAALAMAARFTLTQKFAAAVGGFPWEALVENALKEASDGVGAKLESLERTAPPAEAS